MYNSPKISTLIIEDAIETQKYLTKLLEENCPVVNIIGYSDSISKSVPLINRLQPELIFMDIELTDGYSFEIFNKLKYKKFEVIFVTAFDNLIQKALDHYAFSFITKPIDENKLVNAVEHYVDLKQRLFSQQKHKLLMEFLDIKTSKLLLHVGNEYISVTIGDIIKCEADGNYTNFSLLNNKKHQVSKPLNYFEKLLIDKGFFKAHRSIIINVNHIQSIYKKETIILKNNDKIHVSVRNKSNLTDLINLLS